MNKKNRNRNNKNKKPKKVLEVTSIAAAKARAKDTKKERFWLFEAPESGIVYKLKKLSRFDLMEILSKQEDVGKLKNVRDLSPDKVQALKRFACDIVIQCVHEPKITLEGSEDSLSIDDVADDIDDIQNAIMRKHKLDPKSMRRMWFFRPQSPGAANREASPEVPETPHGPNSSGTPQVNAEHPAMAGGTPRDQAGQTEKEKDTS